MVQLDPRTSSNKFNYVGSGGSDVRIRQRLELGSGGFRALSREMGDLNQAYVLRRLMGENACA